MRKDSFPFAVQENRPLCELSTFKIGGPARYYCEVSTIEEMELVIRHCVAYAVPYLVVGKGSNLLFDDRGFEGLIVSNRISFLEKLSDDIFYVGAGYSFSRLGMTTAKQGFGGLEFAAGIPGSVGGAVFMNAGASGAETASSLLFVDYVDIRGERRRFERKELSFGYRSSPFQEQKGAIVAAAFALRRESKARASQVAMIEYRRKTQPYDQPSAGCVFRNTPDGCLAAGALIESCGLKGHALNAAKVSDLHANFFINSGSAKAQDVLELIAFVRQQVKEKTGVELVEEIRYIPFHAEGSHAS